ncbi:hypothetical protein BT63DRAFT_353894, partial [Microthyrium microscopicum]
FQLLDSLFKNHDVTFVMAKYLDPDTMCNLYAISKDFHHAVNCRYQSFIKASMQIWAPHGDKLFPWHFFRDLCVRDPIQNTIVHNLTEVRFVAGFRWLKMITQRQKITDEILYKLHLAGHPMPATMCNIVQQMWFTNGISSNGNRIGLIHNQKYWREWQLFFAWFFIMKLDMHLNSPAHAPAHMQMRKMFLSHKSLASLGELLKGCYTSLDIIRMKLRFGSNRPRQFQSQTWNVAGVQVQHFGRGIREAWGAGRTRALRIEQLILMECMRRRIWLNKAFYSVM